MQAVYLIIYANDVFEAIRNEEFVLILCAALIPNHKFLQWRPKIHRIIVFWAKWAKN